MAKQISTGLASSVKLGKAGKVGAQGVSDVGSAELISSALFLHLREKSWKNLWGLSANSFAEAIEIIYGHIVNIDLNKPIAIHGLLKDYLWGRSIASRVGQLTRTKSDNGFYAELWYGTHSSGSSSLVDHPMNLGDLIRQNPEQILGNEIFQRFGATPPFLFKLLSVEQPLSIQVHPDSSAAKVLHSNNPQIYQDPFPKPEAAFALTDISLLCGFRSTKQILDFCQPTTLAPEFTNLLGVDLLAKLSGLLKDTPTFFRLITQQLLATSSATLKTECERLYQRLTSAKTLSPEESWILKLQKLYPAGDIGLFFFYLLNLQTAPAGNCIFIKPGTIHAYLDGELAECMAPSDNVVRAGLTSKLIDLKALMEITNFSADSAVSTIFTSQQSGYCDFSPPDQDFFSLGIIENISQQLDFETDKQVELLVCESGQVTVTGANFSHNIQPGIGLIMPAQIQNYQIQPGSMRAFRVRYCQS